MSIYTPTVEDLTLARRIFDCPNGDSPYHALGAIASCLDAIDRRGHPVEEEIRRARALLAVFAERR